MTRFAGPSAARRRFLGRLLAAGASAASLAAAGLVAAQGRGRMDPGEREQLRRDLRERGGWPRDGRGQGRGQEAPRRGPGGGAERDGSRRDRLSEDERQQLRRQLREQSRRSE